MKKGKLQNDTLLCLREKSPGFLWSELIKCKILPGGSLATVYLYKDKCVKCYFGKHKRGREKLLREIDFIQDLPNDLKNYFPKVIDKKITGKIIFYSMPYYTDLMTISKYMQNISVPVKKILSDLKKIMYFTQNFIYCRNINKVPINYVNNVHFNRVNNSIKILAKMEDYKKLISDKNITLNGEMLTNARKLLSIIESDSHHSKLIKPQSLTLFHGNFHTANILTNFTKFIFIDPRGEKVGSCDYDYSKLICHFLIRYDEILEGHFSLRKTNAGYFLSTTRKEIWDRYEKIQKGILKFFIKSHNNGGRWNKKMLLLASFHALSLASYHARKVNPSKKRVTAYYLCGVKLLNEYFRTRRARLNTVIFPSSS